MDREWELQAACRRQDPDLWFSQSTWARAKTICLDECPVREACLEATLAREALTADSLRVGIMAGLTGPQRAALAAERRSTTRMAKPKPPAARVGRPLAPCGTKSAYDRHRRNGEAVDQLCRDAHARAAREYRATGSTKVRA